MGMDYFWKKGVIVLDKCPYQFDQYNSTAYTLQKWLGLSRHELCKVGTHCKLYHGHVKPRKSKVFLGYRQGSLM